MRRDPYLSFRIGSVPVLVLKVMFDIVRRYANISVTDLFAEVRSSLGRHSARFNDKLLHRALAYLVDDGIVVVRDGTVYRKRKSAKRGGWTGAIDSAFADLQRAISIGRRPRKAGGRKKSAGGRRSGRRPGAIPPPSEMEFVLRRRGTARGGARSERRFRETDKEQYRVPIFFATDRERADDVRFSNSGQHATKLQRSTATVIFPAKHRRGKIETPPFIVGSILPKQR